VAREDRTVVFVSHNMAVIRALTTKSILLDRGGIAAWGATDDVIAAYLSEVFNNGTGSSSRDLEGFRRRRHYAPGAKIVRIGISGEQGNQDSEVQIELGTKFTIEVHLAVDTPMKAADCRIYIKSSLGEIISCLWCSDTTDGLSIEEGNQIIRVCAQNLLLTPGRYLVEIHLDPVTGDDPCDVIDDYPLFSVVNTGQIGRELNRRGTIYCNSVEWEVANSTPQNGTLSYGKSSK
jgi:lipopolysaccharide transport system ATP-binding protein